MTAAETCGTGMAVLWSSLAVGALVGFVTALIVTRRLIR